MNGSTYDEEENNYQIVLFWTDIYIAFGYHISVLVGEQSGRRDQSQGVLYGTREQSGYGHDWCK